LEPLHGELDQLDAATEVLSDTRQSSHAELGDFQVMAVAATGDSLQDLVEVLLSCFYLLRIS
jgi:hypothetical protein